MLRMIAPLQGIAASQQRRVHFSRVLHIADGLLDDRVYGEPRLRRIWNYLDDLDKTVGGGAEAFWKRVDAGMWLKMDPSVGDMAQADKDQFNEDLEEFTHGLKRIMRTRGIDVQQLTANTSGIKDPMDTLMTLISASVGIPQRILTGSERGELSSAQDADEWRTRIVERRQSYAGPMIVRQFVDRMIALGALPTPKQYEVVWPDEDSLSEEERMALVVKAAQANQANPDPIMTVSEIRDRFLAMLPLTKDQLDEMEPPPPPAGHVPGQPIPKDPDLPATTATGAIVANASQRRKKWKVMSFKQKLRYCQARIKAEAKSSAA
jgi:hypothetical protein